MNPTGRRMNPDNIFYTDKFSVGLYMRLSDEDKNKKTKLEESESIKNQKEFLKYIMNHYYKDEMVLYKEYFDDDYTGLNFDRPAFMEMLRDVEEKKIDCILVKDFSRFGRDKEIVQQFIEKDFEKRNHKVRFIAYGDCYDSAVHTPEIGVRFIIFMNEEYSRNQSKKVSAIMHSMQESGKYIGSFAPYGYQKNPENKHHLILDPYPAGIVQKIFSLYLNEGLGSKEISSVLNSEQIDSPAVYKKKSGSKFVCKNEKSGLWTPDTVKRILKDEVYTGAVVQGKRRKIHVKDKEIERIPREEWIIVPDRHEKIIDKAVFEQVQALHKTIKKDRYTKDNVSLFSKRIFCGDCGRPMRKRVERYKDQSYISYVCPTYKEYKDSRCSSHYISERSLEEIILNDLNQILAGETNLEQIVKEQVLQKEKKTRERTEKEIENRLKKVDEINNQLEGAEEKWLGGKMDDEKYLSLQNKLNDRIKEIKEEMGHLNKSIQSNGLVRKNWTKQLLEDKKIKVLDRKIVSEMVNNIYVYNDKKIRIVYNYHN